MFFEKDELSPAQCLLVAYVFERVDGWVKLMNTCRCDWLELIKEIQKVKQGCRENIKIVLSLTLNTRSVSLYRDILLQSIHDTLQSCYLDKVSLRECVQKVIALQKQVLALAFGNSQDYSKQNQILDDSERLNQLINELAADTTRQPTYR